VNEEALRVAENKGETGELIMASFCQKNN